MSANRREYTVSEDARRGTKSVVWWEGDDPRMHYQTRQYVPDAFFDANNEREAAWSKNDKRGTHYQQFASIPSTLRQQWQEEFGVASLFENPDVAKKILWRLNSSEWRKLRVGGGNL